MNAKWGQMRAPIGWDRDVPYDIRERAFAFAVRVVKAVRGLNADPATRVLVHQLVRAATSIGANVEEADSAESKRDFAHKLSIACKEARETRYWLRLLSAANGPGDEWLPLQRESEEITRILASIIRSARSHG